MTPLLWSLKPGDKCAYECFNPCVKNEALVMVPFLLVVFLAGFAFCRSVKVLFLIFWRSLPLLFFLFKKKHRGSNTCAVLCRIYSHFCPCVHPCVCMCAHMRPLRCAEVSLHLQDQLLLLDDLLPSFSPPPTSHIASIWSGQQINYKFYFWGPSFFSKVKLLCFLNFFVTSCSPISPAGVIF